MKKSLQIIEIIFLFFVLFSLICAHGRTNGIQTSVVINDRPVIGVLAQEVFGSDHSAQPNNSYIAASYVKFLEGAGAQVVPILINKNETYLRQIFAKINGILFPGGSVPFETTVGNNGFVDAGRLLLRLAKQANDQGDFFPIWGTCLGFEFLIFDESKGQDIRTSCSAWNVRNKLKFTKEAVESELYGKSPKSVVKTLASEDVTVNFHNWCVTPQNFSRFGLDKIYRSLSLNYDPSSSLTYISSIEHRKYPFYAVQFHPEKNIYEWTTKENIPHTSNAVQAAQYFAQFFVNKARQNGHKFSSEKEELDSLIYNYSPIFTGAEGSTFTQKYFFPL